MNKHFFNTISKILLLTILITIAYPQILQASDVTISPEVQEELPEEEKILIENIKLNKEAISTCIGKTIQLTAEVTPSEAENQVLFWESSDESICSVDENGLVKALSEGTATVICKSTDGSDVFATCDVTVEASYVKLNKTTVTLQAKKTATLKATVAPESMMGQDITWKSSDTKVAKVNSNGKITAVKKGTAYITARYVHTLEKTSKIKENRHPNTPKYAILYAKFFENP